jgi:hypothetical protein
MHISSLPGDHAQLFKGGFETSKSKQAPVPQARARVLLANMKTAWKYSK